MTIYRNIIEMSSMSNNDEQVFYTETQITWEDDLSQHIKSSFDTPKLVISRPVHTEEIAMGLNINYRGPNYDYSWGTDSNFVHPPDLTRALDDFHKLKENIKFDQEFLHKDLNAAITSAIAYSFYDCMSGGAGQYYLAACRWFLENHSVDLDEKVYPAPKGKGSHPDGWYTLRDFLKEIEELPRLEKMLSSLKGSAGLLLLQPA